MRVLLNGTSGVGLIVMVWCQTKCGWTLSFLKLGRRRFGKVSPYPVTTMEVMAVL